MLLFCNSLLRGGLIGGCHGKDCETFSKLRTVTILVPPLGGHFSNFSIR
jgi:hypothetical protein